MHVQGTDGVTAKACQGLQDYAGAFDADGNGD